MKTTDLFALLSEVAVVRIWIGSQVPMVPLPPLQNRTSDQVEWLAVNLSQMADPKLAGDSAGNLHWHPKMRAFAVMSPCMAADAGWELVEFNGYSGVGWEVAL